MSVVAAFALIALLFAGFHNVEDLSKGNVNINTGTSYHQTAIRHEIKPESEFKQANIVKQMYDYSCGSAALVTLLNYYLGEDFDEMQVISGMLKYGDAVKITQRKAFSLFDMKMFVNVLGYKGEGYKAEIEDLVELDQPCIVPLHLHGYRHFVVFKYAYKNHVFLADPSKGNISFTFSAFKKIWFKNIAFVVYSTDGVPDKMNALRIKQDDLRFIDEDMERGLAHKNDIPFALPGEKRTFEAIGNHHLLKTK